MKPFGRFIAFAVAIAALAAAFLISAPAHAQDETYVDLSIEIKVGTSFVFTARNQGTATAYGVTVDIEIADQTIHSTGTGQFTQESGSTCSGNIPGTTCISGVWTVDALGVGEETSFTIGPRLASGLACCTGVSTNWTVPARAEIKNTVPEEEERFKGDNAAIGWIWVSQDGTGTLPAEGLYSLEASVDNLLPEAGGTVKFSFKARMIYNTISRNTSLYGVKLRLSMPAGMGTPTATPPGSTTFTAVTDLTRTWDWDIGTFQSNTPLDLVVSTTLDNPLPAGVARSDLCLTAELTAVRPADKFPGDTSAKICLRDPDSLFQTGETDLFDLYSCVGVTTYPCSSADSLELVINGREAAAAAGVRRKVIDPGKVIVQVKDPDGRGQESSNTVWRSGSNQTGSGTPGILPGVVASMRLPSGFNQMSFSISDSTTGGKPGTVRIISAADTSIVILNIDSQTSIGPVDLTGTIPLLFEFGGLGTYGMDITASATHISTSTPYSDTSTFTFHVGPVAELEVRDGGSNSEARADQRAFTIVAVNNGPDDAPDVQVTGLNDGDYVSHNATGGSFDSTTGVWTFEELKNKDFYRDVYDRDGEVLTIFTSADVDTEITASISSAQDYEVCIDSSGDDVALSSPSDTACTTEDATNTWHTAKYYDYISDNDSATIKARDGTGADLPSLQSPQAKTAAIVINWDAVADVNGRKVTHYEVQRETNPWETVAENVAGTTYVDTDIRAGNTYRYRVRAFNDRNQDGPWSAPIEGSVAIQTPEPTPEPTPTPTPEPEPESDPEPSNSSPRFTEGGSTTRYVQENSEPGTDVGSPVAAEDRNRDRLTYELGGTDADSFEIVASSGQIRIKAELDYETKSRYRVSVSVSDGKNSRGEANDSVDDVIDVAISVTNQGEQGSITLSEALPVVGTEIEAELTDPDGGLSGVSWAWERSADGAAQDSGWAEIPGAASRIYTPVDGDSGHYLRVTASYTDGHGPSKSATAALSVPVAELGISERYDADGDGIISLGEALQAASDYRNGIITYDEAIAVANLYFESQDP